MTTVGFWKVVVSVIKFAFDKAQDLREEIDSYQDYYARNSDEQLLQEFKYYIDRSWPIAKKQALIIELKERNLQKEVNILIQQRKSQI